MTKAGFEKLQQDYEIGNLDLKNIKQRRKWLYQIL